MRRPAPTSCPVCNAALRIARLECDVCHTAIEGDFEHGRVARLSKDQLAFALVFLECRGKIKDVEQRLGLSYPTVVSRLEQVVAALGAHSAEAAVHTHARRMDEVLGDVADGKITPKEAASLLRASRDKKKE